MCIPSFSLVSLAIDIALVILIFDVIMTCINASHIALNDDSLFAFNAFHNPLLPLPFCSTY